MDRHDNLHFQLRLGRLYTKLCSDPWLNQVVYLGDPNYIPAHTSHKNPLFWVNTQAQCHEHAFSLWVDSYDEMPFEAESSDLVICHFEHPLECYSFLNDIYRILHKEGRLAWTIKNPYSFYYAFHKDRERFSYLGLQKILESYGFEVDAIVGQSFLWGWKGRFLRYLSLKHEKWLCKYMLFFANTITFYAHKPSHLYRVMNTEAIATSAFRWES